MINLGTEKPWYFTNGDNYYIDFCIWVLKKDGLQVAPFDSHPLGNGELQNQGMDAISWQNWLIKVVATQDNRLNWSIEDPPQRSISEHLTSLERMASISDRDINTSEIKSSLEKTLAWQQEQYQMAVTQLGDTYKYAEPPEVWTGEAKVGKELKKLWQEYSTFREDRELIFVDTPLNIYDRLKPYQMRLATLQIYQVNYPQPVEYIIAPAAAILSVNSRDMEKFGQRVLKVARELAEIR